MMDPFGPGHALGQYIGHGSNMPMHQGAAPQFGGGHHMGPAPVNPNLVHGHPGPPRGVIPRRGFHGLPPGEPQSRPHHMPFPAAAGASDRFAGRPMMMEEFVMPNVPHPHPHSLVDGGRHGWGAPQPLYSTATTEVLRLRGPMDTSTPALNTEHLHGSAASLQGHLNSEISLQRFEGVSMPWRGHMEGSNPRLRQVSRAPESKGFVRGPHFRHVSQSLDSGHVVGAIDKPQFNQLRKTGPVHGRPSPSRGVHFPPVAGFRGMPRGLPAPKAKKKKKKQKKKNQVKGQTPVSAPVESSIQKVDTVGGREEAILEAASAGPLEKAEVSPDRESVAPDDHAMEQEDVAILQTESRKGRQKIDEIGSAQTTLVATKPRVLGRRLGGRGWGARRSSSSTISARSSVAGTSPATTPKPGGDTPAVYNSSREAAERQPEGGVTKDSADETTVSTAGKPGPLASDALLFDSTQTVNVSGGSHETTNVDNTDPQTPTVSAKDSVGRAAAVVDSPAQANTKRPTTTAVGLPSTSEVSALSGVRAPPQMFVPGSPTEKSGLAGPPADRKSASTARAPPQTVCPGDGSALRKELDDALKQPQLFERSNLGAVVVQSKDGSSCRETSAVPGKVTHSSPISSESSSTLSVAGDEEVPAPPRSQPSLEPLDQEAPQTLKSVTIGEEDTRHFLTAQQETAKSSYHQVRQNTEEEPASESKGVTVGEEDEKNALTTQPEAANSSSHPARQNTEEESASESAVTHEPMARVSVPLSVDISAPGQKSAAESEVVRRQSENDTQVADERQDVESEKGELSEMVEGGKLHEVSEAKEPLEGMEEGEVVEDVHEGASPGDRGGAIALRHVHTVGEREEGEEEEEEEGEIIDDEQERRLTARAQATSFLSSMAHTILQKPSSLEEGEIDDDAMSEVLAANSSFEGPFQRRMDAMETEELSGSYMSTSLVVPPDVTAQPGRKQGRRRSAVGFHRDAVELGMEGQNVLARVSLSFPEAHSLEQRQNWRILEDLGPDFALHGGSAHLAALREASYANVAGPVGPPGGVPQLGSSSTGIIVESLKYIPSSEVSRGSKKGSLKRVRERNLPPAEKKKRPSYDLSGAGADLPLEALREQVLLSLSKKKQERHEDGGSSETFTSSSRSKGTLSSGLQKGGSGPQAHGDTGTAVAPPASPVGGQAVQGSTAETEARLQGPKRRKTGPAGSLRETLLDTQLLSEPELEGMLEDIDSLRSAVLRSMGQRPKAGEVRKGKNKLSNKRKATNRGPSEGAAVGAHLLNDAAKKLEGRFSAHGGRAAPSAVSVRKQTNRGLKRRRPLTALSQKIVIAVPVHSVSLSVEHRESQGGKGPSAEDDPNRSASTSSGQASIARDKGVGPRRPQGPLQKSISEMKAQIEAMERSRKGERAQSEQRRAIEAGTGKEGASNAGLLGRDRESRPFHGAAATTPPLEEEPAQQAPAPAPAPAPAFSLEPAASKFAVDQLRRQVAQLRRNLTAQESIVAASRSTVQGAKDKYARLLRVVEERRASFEAASEKALLAEGNCARFSEKLEEAKMEARRLGLADLDV